MFERGISHSCAYSHNSPSRDDELRLLLDWLAAQPGEGVALVGPSADSYTHSDLASALVKRGVSYRSLRQLKSAGGAGSIQRVVALWPTRELLAYVEDHCLKLTALAVLTWNFADIDLWVKARIPHDVLGLEQPSAPFEFEPVLLGALKSLTSAVNLSSGLSHPSDWDNAVLTFRRLRDSRINFDPELVEAWAMANGWSSKDATDLGSVARDIASGNAKRLKAGKAAYPSSMLDYWRGLAQR